MKQKQIQQPKQVKQFNIFNQEIPEFRELLSNNNVRDYVCNTLEQVLRQLKIKDSSTAVPEILSLAQMEASCYERNGRQLLEGIGVIDRIPPVLSERAILVYQQIKSFIYGKSVLDLGCGDGNVGKIFATKKNLEVALADVYEHTNVIQTGLPFYRIAVDGTIPTGKQYDNTLVLTVLHHADDPIKTLQEAKRVTKEDGRIIVIESVYGIADNSSFGKLSEEEQRLANIFFDHFYNRVVHYNDDPPKKVNVPYNFNTPKDWKQIFEAQGLEQIAYQALGIDQPIVPEYHTLHVLQKKKKVGVFSD